MQIRCWRLTGSIVCLLLCHLAVAQIELPLSTQGPLVLFQLLEPTSSADAKRTLTVALSPTAWRVGSMDGPPASAAQLDSVLGGLRGVLLTERCAGSTNAFHQCSAVLDPPQFAGFASAQTGGQVFGWVATDASASAPSTRYFGLLQPQGHGTPESAAFGARLVLLYGSQSRKFVGPAFDADATALVIHGGGNASFATLPERHTIGLTRSVAGATANRHSQSIPPSLLTPLETRGDDGYSQRRRDQR